MLVIKKNSQLSGGPALFDEEEDHEIIWTPTRPQLSTWNGSPPIFKSSPVRDPKKTRFCHNCLVVWLSKSLPEAVLLNSWFSQNVTVFIERHQCCKYSIAVINELNCQVSEKEYVPREREGDRSSSSTNSGKLKCWTDVMESYEAEPHLEPRTGSPLAENPYEQELRQRDESIIGSLQKTDRKYRSSSTLKTHPDSQSRPDSYTSGYSSSSSVTASGEFR